MADGPSPEGQNQLALPAEVRQQLVDRLTPAIADYVAEERRSEAVADILTALPQRLSVTQTTAVTETTFHSGRLPTPEVLERYEHLHPGMAGRLLAMAEKGQQAEIDSVTDINRRTDRYQLLALGAGFISLILILGFAYAFAKLGEPWVAGVALGIGVSGIIATLVNAPFGRSKSRLDENPSEGGRDGD